MKFIFFFVAVDRSLEATVSDARDALVNAVSDCLASYRSSLPGHASMGTVLISPPSLSLFPLFVSGLLKCRAFRVGSSTKLDDRIAAMIEILSMPIFHIMHMVYPTMYPVHTMHLKVSCFFSLFFLREDPDGLFFSPPRTQQT